MTSAQHAPEATECNSPVTNIRARAPREPSPVWDIEVEDGRLPSGSSSCPQHPPSVHSEGATELGGTVLLDTTGYSSKWAVTPVVAEEVTMRVNVATTPDRIGSPGVRSSQSPSIGPSNSASQVAFRRQQIELPMRVQDATSRYFAAPAVSHCPRSPEQLVSNEDVSPSLALRSPSSDDTQDLRPHPQAHEERLEDDIAEANATAIHGAIVDYNDDPLPVRSPGRESMSVVSPIINSSTPAAINRPASQSSSLRLPGSVSPLSPSSRACPLDNGQPFGPGPVSSPPEEPLGREHCMGEILPWSEDLFEAGHAPMFLSDVATFLGGSVRPASNSIDDTGEMAGEEWSYHSVPEGQDAGEMEQRLPYRGGGGLDHDWQEDRYAEAEWMDSHTPYDLQEAQHCHSYPIERFDDDLFPDHPDAMDFEDLGWADEEPIDDLIGHYSHPLDVDNLEPQIEGHLDLVSHAESEDLHEWEDEPESDLDDSEGRSMLGSLQRFSQGRALLMGVSEAGFDIGGRRGVPQVEEDVARSLRDHWRPQRF